MAAYTRGNIATSAIADRRRAYDVSKKIMLYEPNVAKFTVMLMRMHKLGATTTRVCHYDDEADGAWSTVTTAATAAATAIVVADSTIFGVNGIAKVASTGEPMLITAIDDDTNTLTVTRGYGTTAAAAIAAGASIEYLGPAHPEGDDAPEAKSNQPTEYENVTQIVRTSVDVTRSQEQEAKTAGHSERERQQQKKLKAHRKSIERFILRGEYKNDTSANRRTMRGLCSFAESIYDAEGIFTEYKLDELAEMAWAYTDVPELTWVCGGRTITVVNRFASSKIFINDMASKKYGMKIKALQTSRGILNLVDSKAFEQAYAYDGLICDMDDLYYRSSISQINPS